MSSIGRDISKVLKTKRKDKKLLQARIDKDVFHRLRLKLGKNKIKVSEFFEAAARSYLEETK